MHSATQERDARTDGRRASVERVLDELLDCVRGRGRGSARLAQGKVRGGGRTCSLQVDDDLATGEAVDRGAVDGCEVLVESASRRGQGTTRGRGGLAMAETHPGWTWLAV